MPRRPRRTAAGMCHHVMARGNDRCTVFVDDVDRDGFLRALGRISARRGWSCLAYCLMGTHFHLAVTTSTASLSDGMRDLLASHAREVNRRHGRVGHLFRERFLSVDVRSDAQLVALLRYIALNPVEAGIAGHPAEWRWSSFAATVGLAPVPAFLAVDAVLALFGGDPISSRARFRELVGEDVSVEDRPEADLNGVSISPVPAPVGLPSVEDLLRRHGAAAGPAICVALGHSQTAVAHAMGITRQAVAERLRRYRLPNAE